mgnify:CR=1 FL=1|tara:strand:+ start:47 stop:568 length:522 start_codon:yes stop_codon:yes gene_type:complete
MSVSVEAKGIKEITQMFNGLPKRVNKDAIWGRFWKKVTVPLLDAAIAQAPVADRDVVYPPDKSLKIARGTLRDSLKFYRTRASKAKDVHGAYIGPRVKGKFKKNMGGYYGAWVEYGHRKKGGGMTKADPFMMRAWSQKSGSVLENGFTDAEKIFIKAVAADVRRMKKYGRLGY